MATVKSNLTWQSILEIRAWTSLQEVTSQFEMISSNVYRIFSDAYLVTQPYNRKLEHNHPAAPFITMAIWAGSPNALKRCFETNATIDIGSLGSKPPEILLLGTQGTYGELEKIIPQKNRKMAERAIYSNTGAFVHKIIEIDRFRFCFLNSNISENEKIYAIEIVLS